MRRPSVKPGQLHMYWGREARGERPDVIYHSGDGVSRRDRALLHYMLGSQRLEFNGEKGYDFAPSLFDELVARGYDLTTLRFSIAKLPTATHEQGEGE